MDNKRLKQYMLAFPGSFVGFFEVLADVLSTLGFEWTEADKKEWGEVFIDCGKQCANVATALVKIREEFEKEKAANV